VFEKKKTHTKSAWCHSQRAPVFKRQLSGAVTTNLGKYASHALLARESNKDPTQASNFHKHHQKKKLGDPTSIGFLTV